jgi:hypothetical protein
MVAAREMPEIGKRRLISAASVHVGKHFRRSLELASSPENPSVVYVDNKHLTIGDLDRLLPANDDNTPHIQEAKIFRRQGHVELSDGCLIPYTALNRSRLRVIATRIVREYLRCSTPYNSSARPALP